MRTYDYRIVINEEGFGVGALLETVDKYGYAKVAQPFLGSEVLALNLITVPAHTLIQNDLYVNAAVLGPSKCLDQTGDRARSLVFLTEDKEHHPDAAAGFVNGALNRGHKVVFAAIIMEETWGLLPGLLTPAKE